MPAKLMRGCKERLCPKRAVNSAGYCEDHERKEVSSRFARNKRRASSDDRSEHHSFYNSQLWRNMRRMHLHKEPVCQSCGIPGDMVDHIIPMHEGGDRLDPFNLQTLCNRCHAKKRGCEGNKAKRRLKIKSFGN